MVGVLVIGLAFSRDCIAKLGTRRGHLVDIDLLAGGIGCLAVVMLVLAGLLRTLVQRLGDCQGISLMVIKLLAAPTFRHDLLREVRSGPITNETLRVEVQRGPGRIHEVVVAWSHHALKKAGGGRVESELRHRGLKARRRE